MLPLQVLSSFILVSIKYFLHKCYAVYFLSHYMCLAVSLKSHWSTFFINVLQFHLGLIGVLSSYVFGSFC